MKQLPTFILLLILMSLPGSLRAQNGELIIRQGHRDVINMVIYSPDGRYVYTAGQDKLIKIWDVNTGIDFRTLHGHTAGVACLEITQDGNILLSGDKMGNILVWDMKGPGPAQIINAHEGAVNTIKLMPDGFGFVSGGSDKLIKKWGLNNLELEGVVEGLTGEVRAIGISPDGKKLISGGFRSNDVELLLIDLENKTIIDDALKHVKGAGAAKAYTAAILAPLALATSLGKGKVDKNMLTFYSFNYSNIEFANDGKSALISQNLYLPMTAAKGEEEKTGGTTISIAEFNEDLTQFKNVTKPKRWMLDYPATRALFNQDQTKIIANVNQSIKIYDMANAEFPETNQEATAYEPPVLKEFSGNVAWLNSIAISPDYRTVASSGEDGSIKLWDIESGRIIRNLEGYINPALAVEVMPDGQHMLLGSQGELMTMWDLTTGHLVRTFDRSYDVSHIDVSPDGRYLITTSPDTKFAKLWNFNSGNIVKTFIEKNENIIWAKFDEDPEYVMAATENGEVKLWSVKDNKIKKKLKENFNDLEDKYSRGSLNCEMDSKNVRISENGKEVFSDQQIGVVTDAVFTNDGRSLITTNDEGEISVYHIEDYSKAVSMAQIGSFDFITYTPDFYYTSSKGASVALAYKQGDNFLPFEQMELKYNRPDIIAGRLGYADSKLIYSYKAAYEKRINRLGFKIEDMEGDVHLPEISVNYSKLPLASSNRSFSYEINGQDEQYNLRTIQVLINEVPAFGSGGLDVTGDASSSINKTIQVELSAGINVIRTSLINEKGMESIPAEFEINYDAEYYKPSLYIASIGVSEYETVNDLTFAHKDAQDIVSTMGKSQAFENMHSKILTDEQVTSDNIKSLRPFLEQAGIDDVVIIFLAGHGLLDYEYNYYFGTYDIELGNEKENGLRYEELEILLDGLACRNKLLFMDTCHAGELDKKDAIHAEQQTKIPGSVSFRSTGEIVEMKEDAFGLKNTLELSKSLFGDLRKGTGSTVISAAGAAEYAIEGLYSPNGLFTACFLEGIKTRRADLDRDRQYTVSEFRSYVSERVIDQSKGMQVPTSREENIKNDFRIY
jgi:WD40 repeat protein